MSEKEYPEVPWVIEYACSEHIKLETNEMVKKFLKSFEHILVGVADEYIQNHLVPDVIRNYDNSIRQEVCECSYIWSRQPNSRWGKDIRRKIFEDHREEIIELIKSDEIDSLKEQLDRLRKEHRELKLKADYEKLWEGH